MRWISHIMKMRKIYKRRKYAIMIKTDSLIKVRKKSKQSATIHKWSSQFWVIWHKTHTSQQHSAPLKHHQQLSLLQVEIRPIKIIIKQMWHLPGACKQDNHLLHFSNLVSAFKRETTLPDNTKPGSLIKKLLKRLMSSIHLILMCWITRH